MADILRVGDAGDLAAGVVDFFIDGEFVLSEAFERSWDRTGSPVREPDKTDPVKRIQEQRVATSARVKVAKLAKSSNALDRELAGEYEEMFGPDSCFARSWFQDAELVGDGPKEYAPDAKGEAWDGEGEPDLFED